MSRSCSLEAVTSSVEWNVHSYASASAKWLRMGSPAWRCLQNASSSVGPRHTCNIAAWVLVDGCALITAASVLPQHAYMPDSAVTARLQVHNMLSFSNLQASISSAISGRCSNSSKAATTAKKPPCRALMVRHLDKRV